MDGRRVEKPWGHELIWAETPSYVGKVIVIEDGHRLSLQYHNVKDETIFVLEGRLRLHIEGEGRAMTQVEILPGGTRHIPPGTRHRFEAIERVRLIEVSTPQLDDVVRLEDDFGRAGTTAP